MSGHVDSPPPERDQFRTYLADYFDEHGGPDLNDPKVKRVVDAVLDADFVPRTRPPSYVQMYESRAEELLKAERDRDTLLKGFANLYDRDDVPTHVQADVDQFLLERLEVNVDDVERPTWKMP